MHPTQTIILPLTILLFAVGCGKSTTSEPEPSEANTDLSIQEDYEVDDLGGWGPERELFTLNNPSTHITFNSITDNPAFGDERYFMQIKPKNESNKSYRDGLEVRLGETYQGYVYFANSATPSLGKSATNSRIKLIMPSTITGAGEIFAVISADNATPRQVWDSSVVMLPNANSKASLRYVPGSAVIHSRGMVDGQKIKDEDLFGGGALLGVNKLDGSITGSTEDSGYITFDFTLGVPDFTMDTLVRSPTTSTFTHKAETKVGDIVEMKIRYENTGTVQQDNVTLALGELPEGVDLVEGSAQIATSTTGGYVAMDELYDVHMTENMFIESGVNIGSYAPDGDAYIKISIETTEVHGHNFRESGPIFRHPVFYIRAEGEEKSDGAPILVFGND